MEWKEISCASKRNKKGVARTDAETEKLIAYQVKLATLGYEVPVTGRADQTTIKAHNLYFRKTKKEERKRKRKEKKRLRKLRKKG